MTLSHVPKSEDPGGPGAINPGELVALRTGVAFDVDNRLGILDFHSFRDLLLGPCVRCLRFVITVLPSVTITQDSLSA